MAAKKNMGKNRKIYIKKIIQLICLLIIIPIFINSNNNTSCEVRYLSVERVGYQQCNDYFRDCVKFTWSHPDINIASGCFMYDPRYIIKVRKQNSSGSWNNYFQVSLALPYIYQFDHPNNPTSYELAGLTTGYYEVKVTTKLVGLCGYTDPIPDYVNDTTNPVYFHVDTTPPSVPSGFSFVQEPESEFYESAAGTLYTSSQYITIEWEPSIDEHCNVPRDVNGQPMVDPVYPDDYKNILSYNLFDSAAADATPVVEINFEESIDIETDDYTEGIVSLYFSSLDCLDNESAKSEPVQFFLDKSGPAPVDYINTEILSKEENGIITVSDIRIDWNQVLTDYPVNGSGVGGYHVTWVPSSYYHSGDFDISSLVERIKTESSLATSTEVELDLLERGQFYTFAVRSVDRVNNEGEWSFSEDVYIPEPPLKIEEIYNLEATVDSSTGEPEYRQQVVFNWSKQSLLLPYSSAYAIDGMRLETDYGQTYNYTVQDIITLGGELRATWTEANGNIALDIVLTGSEHAHKTYTYSVYTLHKDGGAVEFGNEHIADPVANIQPDFTIQVCDENSNLLGVINKQGYGLVTEDGNAVPTTADIFNLYTNEKVFFHIIPPKTDGTDAEGDLLRYQLRTLNNRELGASWADPSRLVPIELLAGQSSVYHCFISVDEYTSNLGVNEQALSAVYSGYLPQNTLHDQDSEGFYIHFDLQEGAGAFEVRSRDGERVLSKTAPTTTEQVSIVIQENAITDMTGAVNSGIQAVYVWNVDTSQLKQPDYTVVEDIIPFEPADSQKTNLGITSVPGENVPQSLFKKDWNLLPLAQQNQEQMRVTAMKVIDGAGNNYYYLRIVKLDRMPPDVPDIDGFSHSHTGSNIIVNWQRGELQEYYRVVYKPAPGAAEVTVEISEPQISIPITSYGPNQPVAITVYAIDTAGNVSEGAVYTPYTLATLGVLQELSGEYSQTLGHYLSWTVSGGAAKTFELHYVDENNPAVILLVDGVFQHTQLTPPHGTFSYRLVAVNGSNDRTFGQVFTRTLQNNPPSAPTDLSPSQYSTDNVKLSWQPAVDVDGDTVTYSIYFKENNTSSFSLLGTTQDIACVYPEGTGTLSLEQGKEYSFYIVATDSFDGATATSATMSFMVDAIAPTITFIDLPEQSGSASNEELLVEIFEEDSGLALVGYWTSDGRGSEAEPISVSVEPKQAGTYEARIPLHEGAYTITVKARDNAGNEAMEVTDEYYVDQTLPEIRALSVDLDQAQGGALGSNGQVPVQLLLWDNYSGIKGLRYAYTDSVDAAVSEWTDVLLEPVEIVKQENTEKEYVRSLSLQGNDGEVYYLVVQVYDWALNYSTEYRLSQGILLDTSDPELTLNVSGCDEAYSRYYISTIEQLVVEVTHADAHSGIESELYAISDTETLPADLVWHQDYTSTKATALTAGKSYKLIVQVENSVGLTAQAESMAFVYDNTPPVALTLSGLPSGPVVSGEEVRIFATATELESAIIEYELAIGTEQNMTAFSELLNGNEQGWLKIRDPQDQVCFQFNVPDLADGSYTLYLRVKNATNLISTLDDAGTISLDNSQERVLVMTDGLYSVLPHTLAARWEYKGLRAVTTYNYRIITDQGVLKDWSETTANQIQATGLALTNGQTYYFEVRAGFEGTTETLTGRSQGIKVDYTAPVFATQDGIDAPTASTSNGLWVSWQAMDNESGIAKVQVMLEKLDQDNNIIPVSGGWIDLIAVETAEHVPINTDVSGNPLPINTGDKVNMTLRVCNGAGLAQDRAVPVITIDNTPPPAPQVIDIGEVINTSQYPLAHWLWTQADPESGTVHYEWTIVNNRDDLAGAEWYEDDGTHEAKVEEVLAQAFNRVHGATWYFVVRAYNGAGLNSVGMSNGILYDETAPFIAEVKLVRGMGTEGLLYVEDFANANLLIQAFEDIALIEQYKALYGHWDANQEWVRAADSAEYSSSEPRVNVSSPAPQTTAGEIVVYRGMCMNQAGLVSEYGYSKGAMVVTGTPAITAVQGRVSGTELFFDWDVDNSHIPLEGYSVELRSTGSGSVVYSAFIQDKYLVIDAETQGIGEGSYTLYVKAKSVIGLYSQEWGVSPAVVIDRSAPVITTFTTTPFASQAVLIYCEASDSRSGISEYQYCIGTFENADLFTEGWNSEFSRLGVLEISVSFNDLASGIEGLVDGSSIYVRIRVKNGVGLWSPEKTSNAIIIDKTGPGTPVVNIANPYIIYAHKIEGVSITSSDEQSGITHYAYAAVPNTDAQTLEQAEWQEVFVGPGVFTLEIADIVLENLTLTHGDSYYAAVKVRNGAGVWSEIGTSPEIKADLDPAHIVFKDGPEQIVLNNVPAPIEYELVDDISPDVEVVFILQLPTGGSEEYPAQRLTVGTHSFTFDKPGYGTYELQAILTDTAGNVSDVFTQGIRVNSPPDVTLTDVETTPGKPLELSAHVYDEDEPFTYSWEFGDGKTSIEAEPTHSYFHSDQYAQESTYTIKLTVTDRYGLQGSAQAAVTVRNTEIGQLYADEYWSGEHRIRGNILVPEAIRLTVMSGTSVIITSDPVQGVKHTLTIAGRLVVQQAAQFAIEQDTSGLWGGIVVMGQAEIDGAVIKRAERGLAIAAAAEVTLKNTTFEHNEIGVHTLKSTTIESCGFRNSLLYGIKEERNAEPAVINCVFAENTYDYYDDVLTVITIEILNTKPGCSGNIKE